EGSPKTKPFVPKSPLPQPPHRDTDAAGPKRPTAPAPLPVPEPKPILPQFEPQPQTDQDGGGPPPIMGPTTDLHVPSKGRLDRDDIPAFPLGHHVIGIWSFDQSNLTADGGMDLLIRYDDALAAEKGLSEDVLKLWKYDGQWERLDFDPTFLRDPGSHTLFVHT